jgi:pSer/pThr/pTyr-binding forkhead associated (FHA) protein/Mg-chelatase subunit ChlD
MAQPKPFDVPSEIDRSLDSVKSAESETQNSTARQSRSLDVVLVLDNSGSMKKNDPQALMRRVVSSFADRLSDRSRLAILAFGKRVDFVLDLTPVKSEAFDGKLGQAFTKLTYHGKLTDIPLAVERAIYTLRVNKRADADRIIILITDGIIDIGNPSFNLEQSRWLRESLALEAKQNGIRIFGIAFTEEADYQLLQSLSQVTRGAYYRVLQAEHIPGLFEQILQDFSQLNRDQPSEVEKPFPASSPAPVQAVKPDPVVVETRWQYHQIWILIAGILLLLTVVLSMVLLRRRSGAMPYVQLTEVGEDTVDVPHIIRDHVTRIGRDPDANDIVIPHDTVSAQHALIEYRNGIFYIRDLKSGNGTSLNGYLFSSNNQERELPLKNLDRIRFDEYEFQLRIGKGREEPIGKLNKGEILGRTVLRASSPPHTIDKPSAAVSPVENRSRNDDQKADGSVMGGEGKAESKASPSVCSSTLLSAPPPPDPLSQPSGDKLEKGSELVLIQDHTNGQKSEDDEPRVMPSTIRGIAPPHASSHPPEFNASYPPADRVPRDAGSADRIHPNRNRLPT